MVFLVIPAAVSPEVGADPKAMKALDTGIRENLHGYQKPPDHTYAEILGEQRQRMTPEESVVAILEMYCFASGGVVTGSPGHRSYWCRGKLVAHTWPADDGYVWLRMR